MDLKALQRSPAAFRAALQIDTDAGPRPFSEVCDDWQAEDFAALDRGWRRVAGQRVADGYSRAWLERPRGHSKTSDLAVQISWGLFASRRQLSGIAAAADKDQARLLRDAISRLTKTNEWLSRFLDVGGYRISNPHTGSTLEIISADAATSYGLLPDFLICDEVCHWPKRDLWDSLLSSAAKRSHCMLIVISNAGFTDSWQFETREAIRTDPNWFFSRLDGPVASWISPRLLDEQRRLLPSCAYERLWENRWSAGGGDALSEADIIASVRRAGPLAGPERDWQYVGGVDLGLSRDSSAFIVVGRHTRGLHPTGLLRLAGGQAWTPRPGQRVQIEAIEAAILAAHEKFHLDAIAFDPWQSEFLQQRLRRRGIAIINAHFSASNLFAMATETIEAFSERRIELYRDEALLADLRSLRVSEKNYGYRLEPTRDGNGHGDRAVALSLALLAARHLPPRSLQDSPKSYLVKKDRPECVRHIAHTQARLGWEPIAN